MQIFTSLRVVFGLFIRVNIFTHIELRTVVMHRKITPKTQQMDSLFIMQKKKKGGGKEKKKKFKSVKH